MTEDDLFRSNHKEEEILAVKTGDEIEMKESRDSREDTGLKTIGQHKIIENSRTRMNEDEAITLYKAIIQNDKGKGNE